MYIVIVGGGKVGYYLSKTLLSYGHTLAIIELSKAICEKVADELSLPVLHGDATRIDVLEAANTDKAGIFIAVTGQDEENLIACQLAKKNFGVERTIARVNNPKNIKVFEALGVDTAVSSTSLIADLIEQEVDYSGMKTLTNIKKHNIVVSEIEILRSSPVHDKKLRDLSIPEGCIIISIIKRNEALVPNDNTLIREGDSVIAVSTPEGKSILHDFFVGK